MLHPIRSVSPTSVAALSCAVAVCAVVTGQVPATPAKTFARMSTTRQHEVLAALIASLPASPLRAATEQLAATADSPQVERSKARSPHRAKRTVEFPHETDPLHRRVDYAFGLGTILLRDGKAGTPPKGNAGKTTGDDHGKPHPDPVWLLQALDGVVPDADKALAVLLQRLDTDTGGDAFAAFLHSWRNGDESFYEALDRTAGTKDSVFFYDVMLDDFRGQFGQGTQGKALRGLQATHDALHDAFLAYRQYRGFREAIAWSLLLPPDAPLPTRLQRYETKVEGSYSLRQQVLMVDLAFGHDIDQLVAALTATAPPLPQPIWGAHYDPHPAWMKLFMELQPKMLAQELSTDAFLRRAEQERRELANTLSQLARDAVQRVADDGKAH